MSTPEVLGRVLQLIPIDGYTDFARADEFEADAYASALLVKSGIGTAPQRSLFEKLEHLTGTAGKGTPAWMLSHPKTALRIAAIAKNEARWTK